MLAIDLNPFSWLADALSALLLFFTRLIEHNSFANSVGILGIAIIFVVILVRIVLIPLTFWQNQENKKNAAIDKILAPELEELKKLYSDSPIKLNQATMELHEKNGIHPLYKLTGCLPSIVAYPFLVGLFLGIPRAAKSLPVHDLHFLFLHNISLSVISSWSAVSFLALILPALAILLTIVPQPNLLSKELRKPKLKQVKFFQFGLLIFIGILCVILSEGVVLYWTVQSLFLLLFAWVSFFGKSLLKQSN